MEGSLEDVFMMGKSIFYGFLLGASLLGAAGILKAYEKYPQWKPKILNSLDRYRLYISDF
jgi:hypothetical protein